MAAGSIALVERVKFDSPYEVEVTTIPCVVCGESSTFRLRESSFNDWQYGQHIQTVFPDMSATDRETLISGTHGPCWDKLWAEEED